MNSEFVEKHISHIRTVVMEVETILDGWSFKDEGNLPTTKLLEQIGTRLHMDVNALKEANVSIRSFIHQHPDYTITQGAKGGITPRSVYNAKVMAKAVKVAKKAAKQQAKVEAEAQVERAISGTTEPSEIDTDPNA